MKKNDIVQELASRCEISEEAAARVLETLFEAETGSGIIPRAINSGERLTVPGFGTFGVKSREARAEKPGNGVPTIVAAKRYAYFKPARPMRDLVTAGPPQVDDDDTP
ncbi:MAG: nucleoid DNA-binding protein [Myxococcota bacterium]|jgi:nucleoid DNA-binding protein